MAYRRRSAIESVSLNASDRRRLARVGVEPPAEANDEDAGPTCEPIDASDRRRSARLPNELPPTEANDEDAGPTCEPMDGAGLEDGLGAPLRSNDEASLEERLVTTPPSLGVGV